LEKIFVPVLPNPHRRILSTLPHIGQRH
jgi:hypothetical protein